jgi:hypothetical protein
MDRYLQQFIAHGLSSFSKHPVLLPKPQTGHTWTISWKVDDRDLVSTDQVLVTAVSDSGGETETLSAVMPGRMHILTPDGPFIPECREIGMLEFGLSFDAFLSFKEKEEELENQKAATSHRAAKEQHRKALAVHTHLKSVADAADAERRTCEETCERLSEELRNLENMSPEESADPPILLEILLRRVEDMMPGNIHAPYSHIFSLFSFLEKRLQDPETLRSPKQYSFLVYSVLSGLYDRSWHSFSANDSGKDLRLRALNWERVKKAHLEHFLEKLVAPLPSESTH